MAQVLAIEAYNASPSINLLDTANIMAVVPSLSLEVSPSDEVVTSTFYLLVRGSTATAARTNISSLIALLDAGVLWHSDIHQLNSTWIKMGANGETAKRYLVRSYTIRFEASEFSSILQGMDTTGATAVVLAITHNAVWEASTSAPSSAGSTSMLGGVWDLSAYTTTGEVPYRLERTTLTQTQPTNRLWLGVRRKNRGVTGFNPVLDLVNSTLVYPGTDATVLADTNAHTGSAVQVSFATSTAMVPRVRFNMLVHHNLSAGTFPYYYGKYALLLRYRYSNTNTVAAIRVGFTYSDIAASPKPPVAYESTRYLENHGTAYYMTEVGNLTLPAYRMAREDIDVVPYTQWINIEAERVAGTGYLILDCLVLMPTDHFLFWDNIASPSGTRYLHLFSRENGNTNAFVTDGVAYGLLSNAGTPTVRNWGLPAGGGVMVVVAERSTGQVKTDAFSSIATAVYKRGRGFNG